MKPVETPVDGITARQRLSLKGDPSRPMGRTLYGAILKAMGLSGCKRVYVSKIAAWLEAHPDFKEADSYPRERKEFFAAGQPIYLMHGPHRYHFKIVEVKDGKPNRLELVA